MISPGIDNGLQCFRCCNLRGGPRKACTYRILRSLHLGFSVVLPTIGWEGCQSIALALTQAGSVC